MLRVLLGTALLLWGLSLPLGSHAQPGPPVSFAVTPSTSVADAASGLFGPLHTHSSHPPDRWWARDKAKHVAFSFLWTLSTQYVLVDKARWTHRDALPVSVGVSFTVGLSKEMYDWRYGSPRRFSKKDLVANAVGIAAAIGVIVL